MSLVTATRAGRVAAERLMVDTCLVTRGGSPVFDETTGQYTTSAATVYSGACKLVTGEVALTEADAGDTEVAVTRWAVHLPVSGSQDVRRGDVVTITDAALDTALVSRRFTVTGVHVGTAKTARRCPVSADG